MFTVLIRKHVIVGLVTGVLVYHKNQIKLFMNLQIAADKYFNSSLAIRIYTFNPLRSIFNVFLDHSVSRRVCFKEQFTSNQYFHNL